MALSHQRADRIRVALDEYLRAVEQDLAAELAGRNGIELPRSAGQAVRAALALRNLVNELPEVHVRVEAPQPAVVPQRPVAAAPTDPGGHDGHGGYAERERYEPPSPEVIELYREFRDGDLENCPAELFKPYAEEFAARARHLQSHGTSDPDDLCGKTIRALTRIAGDRNVRDVFGLSRNHVANWQSKAEQARRERERVLAAPPKKPSGVLARALHNTPVGPLPVAAEEPHDLPPLPLIEALLRRLPVVLLGGLVKHDKVDRLQRQLGDGIEWEATEGNATRVIQSLERRLRDGRVGAVIVLDELIGHRHFEPVVEAARATATPLTYGGKAGKASISAALQEIETMLSQREA
ncbi:MAG: hypothetical protein JNK72_20155 [Myxococcales bacterium]|nr:hypothetical protein [Myxococcales bacterium]